MANITKRLKDDGKPSYRALIRRQGFRTRSATFPSKKAAEAWAKKTEAELINLRHDPSLRAGDRTLAATIDDYIQAKGYATGNTTRQRLQWWHVRLGTTKLRDLTRYPIKDELDSLDTGPATINRYHSALSACLSWAMHEKEWIEANPALTIKRRQEPEGRTRYLQDDEIAALRSACQASSYDRLWLLAIMGIVSGARRGELLNLRWEQITWRQEESLATAELSASATKTKKPRVLVFAGEAYQVLRQWYDLDHANDFGASLIFPGKRDRNKPFSNAHQHWRKARIAAGLWHPGDDDHVVFHTTRHTAASQLVQSGVDLYTVAAVLGHSTVRTSERYAHLATNAQVAAVTSLHSDKEADSDG